MNKKAGMLSSADSIIENKLMALDDIWPEDIVEKLRAKITLHTTVMSMRRTMLMHENADDTTRQEQTGYFGALRVADKSLFNRDAASFPEAYRTTVRDILAMYTGLRAGEILREYRTPRPEHRVTETAREDLIRHWTRTGLIPTETIVDGVSTTVPNALWREETGRPHAAAAHNADSWDAARLFDLRLTLFARTAELSGPQLRRYVSEILVPAHRAAEAEITRRYQSAAADGIEKELFRIANTALIHHADALEKRVGYALDKLHPRKTSAAPTAISTRQTAPQEKERVGPVKKSFLATCLDTVSEKINAARDVATAAGRLAGGLIENLLRPVGGAGAAVTLAAAATMMPAPLADTLPSLPTNAPVIKTPSAWQALTKIFAGVAPQGEMALHTRPMATARLEEKDNGPPAAPQ